jgi:hypothetical protein
MLLAVLGLPGVDGAAQARGVLAVLDPGVADRVGVAAASPQSKVLPVKLVV